MALSAKGAFSYSFLRNAARALSGCRPAGPRRWLGRLPAVARTDWVSLSSCGGLCAVPLSKVEELSHEALIRRTSSLVTDSANTYLSQTTLALVEALAQYTTKRYLTSLGKLTAEEEDAIWQVIIAQRVEVSDRLDGCKRFESNWRNAVSLCELAAETAHKAGAHEASVTAQTNLQVAQSQVEEVWQLSLVAERKLVETKAEEIRRIAEFAAAMEKRTEDTPKAYLRED
ncbi:diablo homolog, mitochondrial-like isoform X2 [Scleropages formosus]|uniref:diablo homolog, mitochondrial-like isoform X2 n=1 Tax=Scleropages formosus TaxID=113540 RepID=UPI0010FA7AB9|nr:diablo homolog, mitochondrial-like isoform X2 [Scleropages formosus]